METLTLLTDMRDSLIEALQTSREIEKIGGFVYLRHPADPLVWLNASVPVGVCTAEDVANLVVRYKETKREPFFEFSPDVSPEVPALLEAAGFVCVKRMPVMALPKSRWVTQPYSDKARIPLDADHGPGMAAAMEAFGHEGSDPGDVERQKEGIACGRLLAAVGFLGDEVVASGVAVGTPRIREIAGIGARPAYQRQGLGGAVINCLLGQFFSGQGEVAWLTPGDDGAEALYRRLGFETVGSQVVYGVARDE